MSNNVVIKVEGLSKHYLLNKSAKQKSDTLYGNFIDGVKNIKNITKKREKQDFWALKDVSFEIEKGDRVGIIGRNGAGKSTLLKILSRITPPTKGRIEITGNVASLLEVGTGFHGDLSGRENIYLNGSILGMTKAEIDAKFDAIVDFSEVEAFIDTPVKRYSSGMYVKLAFAIAAHMDPDILILDEVLAVGDAAFQKKCIDKINDLSSSSGRTILFVSHSFSSIRSICNKGLYFDSGKLMDVGPIDTVITKYQRFVKETVAQNINVNVKPLSSTGEWDVGTDLSVEVSWERGRFAPGWHCDLAFYTFDGVKILALQSQMFSEFSSYGEYNAAEFIIQNVGFASSDLRMDVGIRKDIDTPYEIVVENCATVSPSQKSLPLYKRQDVIIVPKATCKAIKI
ncbi:MAG: ABC transporter ATP-binding protein [Bacteroidota bacterium]|nr:ABC transporter ATP-binding protein [Bacteroidota bacterium]